MTRKEVDVQTGCPLEDCVYLAIGDDKSLNFWWGQYVHGLVCELEKDFLADRCGCGDYHCPCDTWEEDDYEAAVESAALEQIEDETSELRTITEYDNGDVEVSDDFVGYIMERLKR